MSYCDVKNYDALKILVANAIGAYNIKADVDIGGPDGIPIIEWVKATSFNDYDTVCRLDDVVRFVAQILEQTK